MVHPRGQARAVVQEVELPGEGVGVGHASLSREGGEQSPHPVPVRLGGVLHSAASGDGLAILVTDGRAERATACMNAAKWRRAPEPATCLSPYVVDQAREPEADLVAAKSYDVLC